MKIIITICVAFAIGAWAAPAAITKASLKDASLDHYDQRQNGTENYRVNIDGVLVAIAPAESVLSSISSADFNEILELLDYEELGQGDGSKPSTTTTAAPTTTAKAGDNQATAKKKNVEDKPKRKSLKRRIASLLMPFLRRNRNE